MVYMFVIWALPDATPFANIFAGACCPLAANFFISVSYFFSFLSMFLISLSIILLEALIFFFWSLTTYFFSSSVSSFLPKSLSMSGIFNLFFFLEII